MYVLLAALLVYAAITAHTRAAHPAEWPTLTSVYAEVIGVVVPIVAMAILISDLIAKLGG